MREFSFIVPLNANTLHSAHGPENAFGKINTLLLDRFGGYTETHGQGVWKNPDTGEVFNETVAVYSFAAPAACGNDTLNECIRILKDAGEIAVYRKYPNGSVVID